MGIRFTTDIYAITLIWVFLHTFAPDAYKLARFISVGERGYIAVIVGLSLSTIVLAGLLGYYVIINESKSKQLQKRDRICMSQGCVKSAATILQQMDSTVDPCSDFYGFSCGRFVRTKPMPDDRYTYGILQRMEEYSVKEMQKFLEANITDAEGDASRKMKLFYSSCLQDRLVNNESRTVQALMDYVTDSGGSWTLIDLMIPSSLEISNSGDADQYSLEKRFLAAFMYQVPSIFRISLLTDIPRNSSKNFLCLSTGQTVIQDEFLANLNDSSQFNEYKKDYLDFMEKVIQRIAIVLSGDDFIKVPPEVKERLENILNFESELAKLTVLESSETQEPKVSRGALGMNISQLNEEIPYLNWSLIFDHLSNISGVELTELCIENREYISNLSALMENYTAKVVNDYLCWSMVARFSEYLGSHFRRLQLDFRRKVPEVRVMDSQKISFSRWKECIYYSTRAFQAPASLLYWRHQKDYITKASKKVEDMLTILKATMYTIIDSQKWINDSIVRDIIKKRIEQSELRVGFPDYIKSAESIDKQFQDLDIDVDDVFISNWLNLAQHQQALELAKLNQSFDPRNEWLFPPTEANAFYDSNLKLIIVPMGILHEPLISDDRPQYLDFSSLGHVLGHEIGHAMDKDQGSEGQDNSTGINWWPAELKAEYEHRAQCFVDLFSSFKLESIEEYVNGNLTLLENICDYVGLLQAYTAWKNSSSDAKVQLPGLTNYTSEQLFFIHFGQVFCEVSTEEGSRKTLARDPHAPGEFRVNGVLMNTPQFARAFQCAPNTPMNPVDKCDLFLYDP